MNIEIGVQEELEIDVGLAKTYTENKETTTEEYMRITDYLDYPNPLNEENYKSEEVEKCQTLIDFYTEMEDISDGE